MVRTPARTAAGTRSRARIMGADLYIRELFDPNKKQWQVLFDLAIQRRDRVPEDSAQHKKAQKQAEFYFEQMYSQGYFRDPYNDWDLLWKFDVSWWGDVIPMLDQKGRLSVEKTTELLALLKSREPVFLESLDTLPAPDKKYFRQQYVQLLAFLSQAIELGSPIDCSL
jgi:hypothetical protein